jgi:hypothetical protein
MRVGGERHAQTYYPRERDPVPIAQEARLALGPAWKGAEDLDPPPGFDPRSVQPVACCYTDCATLAHILRWHRAILKG